MDGQVSALTRIPDYEDRLLILKRSEECQGDINSLLMTPLRLVVYSRKEICIVWFDYLEERIWRPHLK